MVVCLASSIERLAFMFNRLFAMKLERIARGFELKVCPQCGSGNVEIGIVLNCSRCHISTSKKGHVKLLNSHPWFGKDRWKDKIIDDCKTRKAALAGACQPLVLQYRRTDLQLYREFMLDCDRELRAHILGEFEDG